MLLPTYLSTRKHPHALYSPSCLGPLPRMAVCGASPPSTLGWVRRAFLDLLRNQAERWLSAFSPSDSVSLYLLLVFLPCSHLLTASVTLSVDSVFPIPASCCPPPPFLPVPLCSLPSGFTWPPCPPLISFCVHRCVIPCSLPPRHGDRLPHQTPALLGLQWRGLAHRPPPPEQKGRASSMGGPLGQPHGAQKGLSLV